MVAVTLTRGPGAAIEGKLPFIIGAVSLGTLLQWYDFYLYGALAGVFAAQFFPTDFGHGFLYSLGIFWTGFLVRPVGAVLFGHIGDRVGRKFALTLALLVTGASTFVIGLLPGYAALGWFAPVLLVLARVVQGVAVGGEYGGAVTYVAEHVPDRRRGFYTAWIQTTATLGIVLALLVVLVCRLGLGDTVFADWGWRVPFWVSAALVPLALYIRLKFAESPLYARLREQGKVAANPARESLTGAKNRRVMLLALFGAAAPEGVIWYVGQFYALYYLASVLQVPYGTIDVLMIVVLTLAAPFFVVFGALSDRFGRRNIMIAGFALAAISYWPVFSWMSAFRDNPIVLGVLVFYLVILATMAYGPIAAFLVELFPARVRCTSMSLPYQIGNGTFGGLVPVAGIALAAALGGPLYGLLYPIGIAALGAAVGFTALGPDGDGVKIWAEVGGAPPRIPDQP